MVVTDIQKFAPSKEFVRDALGCFREFCNYGLGDWPKLCVREIVRIIAIGWSDTWIDPLSLYDLTVRVCVAGSDLAGPVAPVTMARISLVYNLAAARLTTRVLLFQARLPRGWEEKEGGIFE